MKKSTALALFGGFEALAAALHCTVKSIREWPNDPVPLSRELADKVIAAKVRENVRLAQAQAMAEQRPYELDSLESDALALD